MFHAFGGRVRRLKAVILVAVVLGSLVAIVMVKPDGGYDPVSRIRFWSRQTRCDEPIDDGILVLPTIDELVRNKLNKLAAKGGPRDGRGADPTVAITRYEVRSGDSLSSIAQRYGVSVDTIIQANHLPDADFLRVGAELLIPPVDGLLYEVVAGDTIWSIAARFGADAGSIIQYNRITDPGMLDIGQKLLLPGVRVLRRVTDKAAEKAPAQLAGLLYWPVRGRITSDFGARWGRFHSGIDIAASHGSPIRAASSGTVTMAGSAGGYGLTIMVSHGEEKATLYAHASRLLVKQGQRVRRGQIIAAVGNTGNSTGPHLHFEVIIRGRNVDPLKYLP